jgi:hypothetical protein
VVLDIEKDWQDTGGRNSTLGIIWKACNRETKTRWLDEVRRAIEGKHLNEATGIMYTVSKPSTEPEYKDS